MSMPLPQASARMNFRKIAMESGFSKSTVSLAFKGDPQIPPVTRQKILKIAERLGYAPSPAMRKLMSEIRRSPKNRSVLTIAILHSIRRPQPTGREEPIYKMFQGATEHANKLGYRWEEYVTHDSSHDIVKLEKRLRSLNTDGVLFLPPMDLDFVPDFKLLTLPAILLGVAPEGVRFRSVRADHYGNVQKACRTLIARGCKRIGLVGGTHILRHVFSAFEGAFFATIYQAGLAHISPLITDMHSMSEIAEYVENNACDGILTGPNCDPGFLASMRGKHSRNVRIATYPGQYSVDRSRNLSGIDEQWELIGRCGMDELARSIEMHRVDTVELPQHLLVPGVWVEGGTTRPLAGKIAKLSRKKSS
jgi:DNA-binding LacI/PurR family transcriptional regulator